VQHRGGTRANALWGRGGKRANALWGRGGRGLAIVSVVAVAVFVPAAASAGGGGNGHGGLPGTFVAPELVAAANANPKTTLHVIVQDDAGSNGLTQTLHGFGGGIRRQLGLIGAAALNVTPAQLRWLEKKPGLTITADAPIKLSGSVPSNKQIWPYESGNARLWGMLGPTAPTIAIVDSGIDANRADFDNGARVLPQVTLTSRTPNSPGDGRGHGTFVASIAAGSAPGYTGAAPNAKILPIDVMDDTGTALTSDVIAACSYILQNKNALNIKVANFSLHSGARNHFWDDPLDQAVEKLWENGVFVVAAAGNYGTGDQPSGVLYAPGNDPFVMTVGAADIGKSPLAFDDTTAPWSAWGYTEDGFRKPEVSAPGRYMVGAVPTSATLTSERPGNVVAPGYMELSGTSFAAPVVAGTADEILAKHPTWTPDQVKGVLMLTATPVVQGPSGAAGVGVINAARAATYRRLPPNPNQGIDAFLTQGPGGALVFDAASWNDTIQGNASWSTASWGDASWGDASWSTASWGDAAFSAASWADASWSDASWADASWGDLSAEDGVEADDSEPAPLMDATAASELQSDPLLALSPAQAAADPSVDTAVSAPTPAP